MHGLVATSVGISWVYSAAVTFGLSGDVFYDAGGMLATLPAWPLARDAPAATPPGPSAPSSTSRRRPRSSSATPSPSRCPRVRSQSDIRYGRQAPECAPPARAAPSIRTRGYASGKDDYLRRLRKIDGQIRGLQKMIDDDAWCPCVVTQVASATRALQEVAVGLLSDH